jgi:glycosyltransferase involved in cell wall biosynthesis
MKIAIIIPRIDQLGPVKIVQSLVNLLGKSGNLQIKVFYLDKIVDPQVKILVPVERLHYRKFCFSDFDIIHTNGIRPDLFAFNNREKIRYHISTIHNLVFEDLKFTYNRLVSFISGNLWLILWRRADKLVCVSNTTKIYYEKWFSSSKLGVIYNGIPVHENSIEPDNNVIKVIQNFRSEGFKVVGSAGVLTKRKGIDQILYMAAEVNYLAVVIIGTGKELKSLKRMSEKLKIADRCYFSGFMSSAVNYFKHFDLFIMPSRSEGFGLVLIEAVQQKVAVICSDIAVFRELFSSDEVTFFRLEDRNSLIEALREALKTGKNKTESAYVRYLNNYTDLLMADRYYEIYCSALTLT